MSEEGFDADEWRPKTRLGRMVDDGEVSSLEEAFDTGLPLKESEIVDTLLGEIEDDVLDINMVQRMTDSGRRVKFRCSVVIGNRDGFIGYAEAKDTQVGAGIKKAIDLAKLNMFKVSRGCGSWECGCGQPHTVALKTRGKAGSVEMELMPAPRGLGLACGETAKSVLELAGIDDIWTRTSGQTRTTVNFAKATYNALLKTAEARVPSHTHRKREVIE